MIPLRWFAPLPLALAAACSQGEPAPSGDGTAAPEQVREDVRRNTSLEGCDLIRSEPEEAGFYEYECEGLGGYRLRLVQADLRENVVVLPPEGAEQSLDLPALADGAFSSIGDVAEWRGAMVGERFRPVALILRQSVMEGSGAEVRNVSYLLAVRLADTPCVVARIAPGPEQDELARAAADAGGECLAVPGD